MRSLTNVFKALSDETRLQMLSLLFNRGELCVCDFVEVLDITQSKASRHLRHLVNAGLLDDRREAIWVHFRLADSPEPAQASVLRMLPDILSEEDSSELFGRLEEWMECRQRTGNPCEPPSKEQRTDQAGKR